MRRLKPGEIKRVTRAHEKRPHRGCSIEEYDMLRQMGKSGRSPIRAYLSQRKAAAARGIGWGITLWEWWIVWRDSGHWDDRGIGQGYVMCRVGDIGEYSKENVFIATSRQNTSEGNRRKNNLPIGVHLTKSSYKAQREINGVHYTKGGFKTAEQAQAQYLQFEIDHAALFAPLLTKQPEFI